MCGGEFVEELGLVGLSVFLGDFELHDHCVIDEHIGDVGADDLSFVAHLHTALGYGIETVLLQLDGHGNAIDRFEKSVAECFVHYERGTDDRFGDLAMGESILHRGIKLWLDHWAKALLEKAGHGLKKMEED